MLNHFCFPLPQHHFSLIVPQLRDHSAHPHALPYRVYQDILHELLISHIRCIYLKKMQNQHSTSFEVSYIIRIIPDCPIKSENGFFLSQCLHECFTNIFNNLICMFMFNFVLGSLLVSIFCMVVLYMCFSNGFLYNFHKFCCQSCTTSGPPLCVLYPGALLNHFYFHLP